MGVRRIVSGGQTGADRGALDAAIALAIEHGGFCPHGRRAEDGRIPDRYRLTELDDPGYPARTEANVIESDGTLLVTRGAPRGGSKLTAELARKHRRPLLCIDLDRATDASAELRAWIEREQITCLNVAGPRASGCPGIADDVRALVIAAIADPPDRPR